MFDFAAIKNLIIAPKGRTVGELRAALEALDVKGAEAAVAALEEERKSLLLTSTAAEIDRFDAGIRAGNLEVERHHAAYGELTRLLGEAEAAEKASEIEARASAARDLQASLVQHFVDLDGHAEKIAQLLAAIGTARNAIDEANKFMRSSGRPDLAVEDPYGLLASRLGISPMHLPNVASWTMPGYWPSNMRHPDGRMLSRMKEIMPRQSRKAAA